MEDLKLGLPDKDHAIKGLVVCWMLFNLISLGFFCFQLQADANLDSPYDHLNIKGESRPYEVRGKRTFMGYLCKIKISMNVCRTYKYKLN